MIKVSRVRVLVGIVVVVLVVAWGSILYWALMHGSISRAVFGTHRVFSYEATLTEYRSAIQGLIYSVAAPVEVKDPSYFKLGDLLSAWNPDDTSQARWLQSAAHPSKGKGLAGFDYMDESQRKMALAYRENEIPFIITNVPELLAGIESSFSSDTLRKNLGDQQVSVEKISSNNYMFYHDKSLKVVHKRYPEWQPPQQDMKMTFEEYLTKVQKAENAPDFVNSSVPLYYYTISAMRVSSYLCTDQTGYSYQYYMPSNFMLCNLCLLLFISCLCVTGRRHSLDYGRTAILCTQKIIFHGRCELLQR